MSIKQLIKLFLSINLNDYENLKLNFEINKFLLVAYVGVLFAIIISSIYRSTVNLTLNRLIRKNAICEESAKTLQELGINLFRVKYILGGSRMRDIVCMEGEITPTYEEYLEQMKSKKKNINKINYDEARFYIQPSKLDEAKKLVLKSNTSVLNTVLFCVLLFIITVTLVILMPEILTWLNDLLAKKS